MRFKKTTIIEKGDLIRVKRKIGYYHYGIATSSNTVIHFSDFDNDSVLDNTKIRIIETSLEDFYRGDKLEINTPYDSPFSRDEVVENAKKFLGDYKFNDKKYNLVTNNCEHFARYVYYGTSKSKQVVNVSAVLAAIGLSLITTAILRKISHKK